MGFLENVRKFWALRRLSPRSGRRIRSCGLSEASRIGILYHAGNQETEEAVRHFAQELKNPGNEVRTLGFVNTKFEDELPKAGLGRDYFGLKGLDFSFRSSLGEVENFSETSFDILIDLNISGHPALLRVLADSAAMFKVGASGPGARFLDLVIETAPAQNRASESKSVKELISYIKQYANKLR
jgi:hypothetical protein